MLCCYLRLPHVCEKCFGTTFSKQLNKFVTGIPYKISVSTGDVPNAGTSAKVFIVMHGGPNGKKDSGKIMLEGGKFQKGRTDIFEIPIAEELSPLTYIDIGHDNSGPGPGWFLDKVRNKLRFVLRYVIS
jgi:hypothetical protein